MKCFMCSSYPEPARAVEMPLSQAGRHAYDTSMQEDAANARTVVDNTLTDSATVAEGAEGPGDATPIVGALPVLPSVPTATLRTTVLPRMSSTQAAPATHQAAMKPRYALAHRLGQGGVGDVIKAHDNDIERPVAIKRIRADVKSTATVLRFAEEVRTIGNLEHPNIVPIHDVGLDQNGEYYFVMKYVHGETLESVIEKLRAGNAEYHHRYGFERRVEIMVGILDAIAFAHANGVIHRDIKPANVMIGPYGEVMVMDWGLARKLKGDEPTHAPGPAPGTDVPPQKRLFQTQVGTLLGTPAYMSPEQARGETLTEKSDIYSLCMTFFELLALAHPFEKKDSLESMLSAVMTEPVPMAWALGSPTQAMVPADLAWFAAGGLEKDPRNRFESVNGMIERLRARAEGDIPVQCKVTFMMRQTARFKRAMTTHPFISGGVIGLLVLWLLATTAYTVVHML
jgi:serine/threonine-protein kinase